MTTLDYGRLMAQERLKLAIEEAKTDATEDFLAAWYQSGPEYDEYVEIHRQIWAEVEDALAEILAMYGGQVAA